LSLGNGFSTSLVEQAPGTSCTSSRMSCLKIV
jgi:hypothetical protein